MTEDSDNQVKDLESIVVGICSGAAFGFIGSAGLTTWGLGKTCAIFSTLGNLGLTSFILNEEPETFFQTEPPKKSFIKPTKRTYIAAMSSALISQLVASALYFGGYGHARETALSTLGDEIIIERGNKTTSVYSQEEGRYFLKNNFSTLEGKKLEAYLDQQK